MTITKNRLANVKRILGIAACQIIYLCFILLIFFTNLQANSGKKNIYRVVVTSPEQFEILQKEKIDIVATQYGKSIDLRCLPATAKLLKSKGFKVDLLQPGDQIFAGVPDGFHNYQETKEFLKNINALYPDITKLDSLGASVENRGLWALKISDNPEMDEDEPCLLIEGCIHGNENHALEVNLYLIEYLVKNYGVNPEVTHWVNNREIWVVPLVNPDGHELNQRRNAHDIDLNRNFGYWWGFTASKYGPEPFSEPETKIIRDLAEKIRPYGSLAFHTAGRLMLYPWAYISEPVSPDDELFVKSSGEMIDSINAVDPQIQYEARRSGVWYWHGGEHNDWMYSQHGMHSFTIELMNSQNDPPSLHENEVVLPALRVMLRRPEKLGVTGLITDSETGKPLNATVKILELFDEEQLQERKSEPLFGRYLRFLTPGIYTLEIYHPGYQRIVQQIAVNQNDPIQNYDFQLTKGADLVYKDCLVVDGGSIISNGNLNGLLNQGEIVELKIIAENNGAEKAKGVFGKLTTNDPFISIDNDSLFFGDADSSAKIGSQSLAKLEISPDVFPGTKIKLKIDFYDSLANHWQSSFYMRIQGFFDNMENEGRNQWSHSFKTGAANTHDDWQYGIPKGENGDPVVAFSGDNIWGTDLGGSGWNGAYQSNVNNYLQMRTLNCSGWTNVYLQFYRWLNIATGDRAYISVNNDIVWENYRTQLVESEWTRQIVDISPQAADNDSVVIKFGLISNRSGVTGGWNIDDVVVHNDVILSVQTSLDNNVPEDFIISQNYPNPFKRSTTLQYYLTTGGKVSITVFDVLGREIKQLIKREVPAGSFAITWDGKDQLRRELTSGLYFINFEFTDKNRKKIHQSRKIMLIK